MKCSKCGYVGFEESERCRNCGYEFALAPSFGLPDLPIRQNAGAMESEGLDDLALIDAGTARRVTSGFDAEFAPDEGEPRPAPTTGRPALSTRPTASELPLFGVDDDTPLITKASPPRAPLSVRRSTPDVPRLRTIGSRTGAASDLALDLEPSMDANPRLVPSERAQSVDWSASDRREDAGILRRIGALAVDCLILSVIDIAVIYLTMQICGLSVDEFRLLPKAPLIAFLVVQNVGYLIAFTASGQTLGKMTAGIEVVPADPYELLDVGRALKRTVAWLVLACPAGLGLLPALLSHDQRGLHDRFAGTRVVRV